MWENPGIEHRQAEMLLDLGDAMLFILDTREEMKRRGRTMAVCM